MKIDPINIQKQTEVYKQLVDENGKSIGDVVAITCYLDGIVVGTKNGLYTNVKELIEGWNKN